MVGIHMEWTGRRKMIKVGENEPVPALFKAVLPDYFEIDYVRVYDEVST